MNFAIPKRSLVLYTFFTLFLCNCSSSRYQLQEQSDIKPTYAYFHEWYAGIKVGGTGYNIYLPNLNDDNKVRIDSIYFRRMKGKLVKGRSRYTAVLRHSSKHYDQISMAYKAHDKKLDKAANFPFDLKTNECVISYFENGQVKYVKIKNLLEKQSIYYEKGAPLAITD